MHFSTITDFDEIFWSCGAQPKDQSIIFCGFLNTGQDPDGFRWQVDWLVHHKSRSSILLEAKRSIAKIGVSLHSSECQLSSLINVDFESFLVEPRCESRCLLHFDVLAVVQRSGDLKRPA